METLLDVLTVLGVWTFCAVGFAGIWSLMKSKERCWREREEGMEGIGGC